MLGDGVFKNLSMRATIDGLVPEGSDTADFIEGELKELSNLHFKSTTACATAAPPTPQTQIPAEPTPEIKPNMEKAAAEQETEPTVCESRSGTRSA